MNDAERITKYVIGTENIEKGVKFVLPDADVKVVLPSLEKGDVTIIGLREAWEKSEYRGEVYPTYESLVETICTYLPVGTYSEEGIYFNIFYPKELVHKVISAI